MTSFIPNITPFTETEQSKCSKNHLKCHVSIHEGKTLQNCDYCNAKFVKQSLLDDHILFNHSDKNHFKCESCDASFPGKILFKNHMKTEHGPKPYKCKFCDMFYVSELTRSLHISSFHEGKKPFQCNFCEKSFLFKSQLQVIFLRKETITHVKKELIYLRSQVL